MKNANTKTPQSTLIQCLVASVMKMARGTKQMAAAEGMMRTIWTMIYLLSPKRTLIALAILFIVDLFCPSQFIMNSMEGSQAIPMYVEYENTLVFSSRHTVHTYLKYKSIFLFLS